MREERDLKGLDKAKPEDLEDFVSYAEARKKDTAKKYIHGVRYYYEYTGNKEMRDLPQT